jgi:hypothetical protein
VKILVACEFSGVVRDAFIARGHEAMSCDLIPTESPGPHYEGDVRDVLGNGWDLMIAHPPCTYLSSSGMHWTRRGKRHQSLTDEAIDFVKILMKAPVKHMALENPVGVISTLIRKPDQIVQPWMFGHDASKATCLWLRNLPPLEPTGIVKPRMVNGKKRWANQTDSGQNKLSPSDDRWKKRSATYPLIAKAMADQWSIYLEDSARQLQLPL